MLTNFGNLSTFIPITHTAASPPMGLTKGLDIHQRGALTKTKWSTRRHSHSFRNLEPDVNHLDSLPLTPRKVVPGYESIPIHPFNAPCGPEQDVKVQLQTFMMSPAAKAFTHWYPHEVKTAVEAFVSQMSCSISHLYAIIRPNSGKKSF